MRGPPTLHGRSAGQRKRATLVTHSSPPELKSERLRLAAMEGPDLQVRHGKGTSVAPTTYILPDLDWADLLGPILRDARPGAVVVVYTTPCARTSSRWRVQPAATISSSARSSRPHPGRSPEATDATDRNVQIGQDADPRRATPAPEQLAAAPDHLAAHADEPPRRSIVVPASVAGTDVNLIKQPAKLKAELRRIAANLVTYSCAGKPAVGEPV